MTQSDTAGPIWQWSAPAIAASIRNGDISAAESVEAHCARMEAVNPALNAVVIDLRDDARATAAQADADRAAGKPLGPLHGVPVTIKTNVDYRGQANTNGIAAFQDVIAPDDSPVVANLRKAGAIALGLTNTPEFSFRAFTDNPLHGLTKNPWSPLHNPGGSSGGGGAAVAAGIGAIAHGNDIGGSLRFPAWSNGLATIKPTLGRVPAYNPSAPAERPLLAQLMSVQGPMAREVASARLGLQGDGGARLARPVLVPGAIGRARSRKARSGCSTPSRTTTWTAIRRSWPRSTQRRTCWRTPAMPSRGGRRRASGKSGSCGSTF